MSDLHPNHPDYVRHDAQTGEIDEDVTGVEILDPISIGALATLQRVEIDQQVATAKAYPRNVTMLRKELTALVTMDEDTADDCIYALPRGKKHIKGPSARFADALISFWGNARSGSFITQVNRDEKFVEAIGSFQDVERNVIRQRRVRRPIVTSQGQIYNLDMINMTGNAACVIAERNAILNGIPKSLWSGAYEQAFALVAGTTKTLGEKLERATKAFALQGITMEQVLEKLGHQDRTKIIPDDIVTMRGMLTALKTGEETVETIFGRGAASNHEKVQNPLKDDPKMTGAAGQVAETDMVVEEDGTVSKQRASNNQTVFDRRFRDGGQRFETFAAWEKATQYLPKAGAPAERTGMASSDGAKIDKGDTVAGKPAEAGSKSPAPEVQLTEKTAQTAAASPMETEIAFGTKSDKQDSTGHGAGGFYIDADGYMGFMRDSFDSAKARASKSAVTEIWGSTRADRNGLLSADQIEELTKDKAATLAAIKLKEPK